MIIRRFTNKYAHDNIFANSRFSWDRTQAQQDKATKALGFAPTADDPFWTFEQIVWALFYLGRREDGMTREQAGRLATRLYRAAQDHRTADQLTVVTLLNSSSSIHPTDSLDLSTDYLSGRCVATALMIEVRGLREMATRAIEEAASIVGVEK
ncbi:hypothetical protein [uncultured Sphingomonas sp.]|uniref:hypothetical protein n=1 Tax=uncultured Sphingomonas sp. TaxID=158754 RepID=UPI0025E39FA5|nr:hypothetical protein [uncultured Sphingomonas sp.]